MVDKEKYIEGTAEYVYTEMHRDAQRRHGDTQRKIEDFRGADRNGNFWDTH